jgi:hypothetical protein
VINGMEKRVGTMLKELPNALVAYLIGRMLDRGLMFILGPQIFVDFESATGIPYLASTALLAGCTIGFVMGLAINAMKKVKTKWAYVASVTLWVTFCGALIVITVMSGLKIPGISILLLLVTVVGTAVATSMFFPPDLRLQNEGHKES